ncbi:MULTISPECIES: phosphoglycolate phosphatase [Lysobacteraceae]|uniref:phosphoglycolate phosphatase n=1 Tax=Novilysobacter avium TaxID=2781023 RepID=A0A7S6ZV77_9GAMM|nr:MULTISPECIES: phosphoglycolate phosphatase [Lysobacter]QOW22922.1 phosphoglycolate phosphatase [Lysobacter avium]QOW25433.1 phosphoglycolate phosphatase [Lysobacter sp. H23M47]
MLFPKVVLFDLDGTLLDSAPDMLATINGMRAARGHQAMTLAELRPHVSKGARAMAAAAFPEVDADERESWIPEFLSRYEQELGLHGAPFDGIEAVLGTLESAGTVWGIVTNKPEYLAQRLIPMLGWQERCAVLIGGDTLATRKPDPLPLVVAAERIGVPAESCIYVGDDERDIIAARAAGMPSVVALWGYRLDGDDPAGWGGDVLLRDPHSLADPSSWPAIR